MIDEVLYFDKVKFNKLGFSDKLKYFCEMRSLLHSKHFDLVIDMQGLFKSAVLAAISGCDNRIGYCEMREGSGFISKAIGGIQRKDNLKNSDQACSRKSVGTLSWCQGRVIG